MLEIRTICFFSSRRRHTRYWRDWSSDVCSSDLSRMLMDRTPVTTAGTTGVLRLGSTFASRRLNGRLLSRAIANIIRIVAVCTARQQTVMAITMQTRNRSEEHTSELQSRQYLVCRLLLEKKKLCFNK